MSKSWSLYFNGLSDWCAEQFEQAMMDGTIVNHTMIDEPFLSVPWEWDAVATAQSHGYQGA